MINLLILKQDQRFTARLRFYYARRQRTEQIEFIHTPGVDPVKTHGAKITGKIQVAGELVAADGKRLAFELTCQQGPLFIAADGAGLRIFTLK